MEGINAIIKLRETPKYWHIMYDKYRNVYYRFAEMPYKLASNESPYDEPKGKEFSVIVLNADFEIIGETKFPGKKYFYKMSFVGREGLYISENNLANPQFDENKLVFTCFKIKKSTLTSNAKRKQFATMIKTGNTMNKTYLFITALFCSDFHVLPVQKEKQCGKTERNRTGSRKTAGLPFR